MLDPLNLNVAMKGVDTTLPLLPEGDYLVQVQESTIDPNKEGTGLNWNLKLGLVNSAVSVDGRDVNPNFPVFALAACQARSDSKDPEAFKRTIGEYIDALMGSDKDNRPDLSHELVTSVVGKQCLAHVIIGEPYQGNVSNKVRRLKKVA